jgi:hypothetical protein
MALICLPFVYLGLNKGHKSVFYFQLGLVSNSRGFMWKIPFMLTVEKVKSQMLGCDRCSLAYWEWSSHTVHSLTLSVPWLWHQDARQLGPSGHPLTWCVWTVRCPDISNSWTTHDSGLPWSTASRLEILCWHNMWAPQGMRPLEEVSMHTWDGSQGVKWELMPQELNFLESLSIPGDEERVRRSEQRSSSMEVSV